MTQFSCVIFLYIFLHLFFYATLGRRFRALSTEKGIFLFHCGSFLIFNFFTTFILWNKPLQEAASLFTLAFFVHGIYSLSFLECWSLAEGGYSISILKIFSNNSSNTFNQIEKLEVLGDRKFDQRLENLIKMRLVKTKEDKLSFTPLGYIIVILTMFIVKLTNRRDSG